MTLLWRYALGAVIGGSLGFAYYRFVGCASGTCPLTSHPVTSTLYGMFLGAVIAGMFQ